jgi:predicted ABC-type ATPase
MTGLVKVQPIDFAVTRGPDVGYVEGATAGVDNSRISRWTTQRRRENEVDAPMLGLVQKLIDDDAPMSDGLREQIFNSDFQANGEFLDSLISESRDMGYELPPELSQEGMQARRETIFARDGARMDANNETLSRATPLGQAGAFVGGMAAEFEDPVNLATIPFGAANGARLATVVATEAALNATIEGLQTPGRNENLVALGQQEESILMNMAVGAIFGASIPLAIRGTQELGGLVSTSSRAIRSRVADLASTSRSPAAQAAGNAMTRDIQQEADAVAVETPEAVREYQTRTDEAQVAASEGRAPDMPERPLAAFAPIDNDGSQLVDPRGLLVQPEVFQFKSEIVAEGGVTPKLQGVTEWVPHRAGVTLVYEYADGSQAVADGHQRTALARRIMAQDPTQNIRLRAQVFREEDGFSVEDVRVLAALKNIGEAADGMTASMAGDAAKVLRLRPEAIADLPRGPGIGRAQNLAKLSDDAFDLFINRVIEQRFAEQIGNMVSDPSMHLPIARLIERVRPETTEQAANIISQAMEAPTSRETTSDLFGETEVVESLYLEQAKVLERAMQIMRTDRSVFKTLTDQSERIEGTGQNRLDKTTNADARGQIEVALGAIKQLAHRAGPISEALRDGAQTYRTDGRLKDAAEKLAAVVRREVERNGLAGVSDGGSRRAPQSSRAEQDAPDPNEGFSDPVGEAAQAQVLQTRIEPRQAPEAGSLDELKALVAAGADRATIDSHPALQDAVARLSAIPETDKLPGYGTDEYEASRPFVFDGESVISVDEALPRWIEGAKRLASDETGTIYNGVSNDRTATIILGPPAAGKSSIANEIAVAQRAAIIDADEIKKTIPEFDGGIGASAVHEESSAYTDALEESLRAEGANVVYPKVGAGAASIERIIAKFKAAGYTVNLVNMAVTPENAYTRMIGRFVATGRIINPKYVDAVGSLPSATFTEIKTKGGADGYAQIDNNGERFDPKTVSETDGGNALAGTRFADDGVGRQGPDAGNSENAGRDQQAEETSAGTQSLIDGVAPITARDRMEAAQAAPITGRPSGSDTQIGGLFDPGDPARSDLFDQVPVGRGFDNDGNEIALTMTRSDLAAELDADDEFIEQIGVCLK